jgi:hypothetical protein
MMLTELPEIKVWIFSQPIKGPLLALLCFSTLANFTVLYSSAHDRILFDNQTKSKIYAYVGQNSPLTLSTANREIDPGRNVQIHNNDLYWLQKSGAFK